MRSTTRARGLAAGALALTLALTLAACGDSEESGSPTPSASTSASPAPADGPASASAEDIALVKKITITGEPGKEPKVTLPETPFSIEGVAVNLAEDGKGEAIVDGQQLSVHVVVISSKDGSVLNSSYKENNPETFTAGKMPVAQLDEALKGAHVGARLAFAGSPQPEPGTTPTAAPETQVYALEVVSAKTLPTRAEGETVAPKEGLPTITLGESGEPRMTPATGDAPTALVAQPLIKGAGATVKSGDDITVKYSGWLWDGTQFDSSWPDTYLVAGVGQAQVIAGWNEGLVGQTVGSQVLLVVPPDKGYGDKEAGSIPPNSTLVFVVDILDAA